MYVKEIANTDHKRLLDEYYCLEKKLTWVETSTFKVTPLQIFPDQLMQDDIVHDSKFKEINPIFKDTMFEKMIIEHNMFRSRLMWVFPLSCYVFHKDYTPRIHIPIITNNDCFFIFEHKEIIKLPTGKSFWTDTTKLHTFVNASKLPRLHLVGSIN